MSKSTQSGSEFHQSPPLTLESVSMILMNHITAQTETNKQLKAFGSRNEQSDEAVDDGSTESAIGDVQTAEERQGNRDR